MKFKIFLLAILIHILLFVPVSLSQQVYGLNLDTVKAQKFDMGKMWTFENPPLDYFEEEYNFTPTDEWFEKVRKSALRLGNGCSGSFISADGLIMTNHHCVRGRLSGLNEEGEDLLSNGFFAESLDDEREIDGLFVDQLIVIKDVTDDVLKAMAEADTDLEKAELRDEKIEELKTEAIEENPDLNFQVKSLYEGSLRRRQVFSLWL
jgi:hypothetical protein